MSDIHGVTWECPKCKGYYLQWDARAKVMLCHMNWCSHVVRITGADVRPFVTPTSAQVRVALYGQPVTQEDKEEERGMEMLELKNEFWLAFSRLCNDTLDKLSDQEHRWELEEELGDKTSIYGRDTEIRSVGDNAPNNN